MVQTIAPPSPPKTPPPALAKLPKPSLPVPAAHPAPPRAPAPRGAASLPTSARVREENASPGDSKKKTDLITPPPRTPPALRTPPPTGQPPPTKPDQPPGRIATTTASPAVQAADALMLPLAGAATLTALAAAAMQIWISL